MPLRAVFRCDASLLIGHGHVRRSLILARSLHSEGFEIIYIMRKQRGDLIQYVSLEFQVITIPFDPPCDGSRLEISQFNEASKCISLLSNAGIHSANLLVIDSYDIDIEWENKVLSYFNEMGTFRTLLLVIDDLANREHRADIILNQNHYGDMTNHQYDNLVPANCKKLLGSNYALLHAKYSEIRTNIKPRSKINTILVYFGGTDDGSYSLEALDSILATTLHSKQINIIVPKDALHYKDLLTKAKHYSNVSLLENQPTLAPLIASADISIGAGGSTTWERCCLGLPCITFIIADNQVPTSRALAEETKADFLCRETKDIFAQTKIDIENIVSNLRLFSLQSRKLMEYTDGKGSERVILAILKELHISRRE